MVCTGTHRRAGEEYNIVVEGILATAMGAYHRHQHHYWRSVAAEMSVVLQKKPAVGLIAGNEYQCYLLETK